ncbi:MAG: FISUMP domain-containing protein [Candidatus Saccharibacteria bacterium]|nr:FISUMP domain-containing protein [Candidatus Saccharibacteria bacterium]
MTKSELLSNLENGVFKESSAIEFSVSTNNYFGYKLFLTADDDSGVLSSGDRSISSISSGVSGASFAAANNTQYNNLWGWRFYNASIPGNDDYQYYNPSPTTDPVELYSTSNTASYDYSLSFGARVNTETAPGVYAKNLNIVAVVNPTTYIMHYDKNTTDDVANMPSTQSGVSTEISLPVSSLLPTRTGYVFKGWCTMSMTNDLCPGKVLQPGDLYGLDQTIENAIFLYAVWTPSMQDYTYNQCEQEAADTDVSLADLRDRKTYSARFINGNCWMTQNLSYDLATNNTLSPETSNVTSEMTLNTVGDLTSGNTYTEARIHIPTEEDLAKTKLPAAVNGYWYNYCAATAGEICADSSTDEATIDICPAGWRMPSDEEWNLIGGDGSYSKVNVDAFSPVATGTWDNSTLYSASADGNWWSTTVHSTTNRYSLNYYPSSGLSSGVGYYRYYGVSARCILDP